MQRKIFDQNGHAHFVTYSCYRRRKLLDDDRAKKIVLHFLNKQLKNQKGICMGFVVMPDHIHAMIHFEKQDALSIFMGQWKRRSSIALKKFLLEKLPHYTEKIDLKGPVWQPKYYNLNIFSHDKAKEKLAYMHHNPIASGLVKNVVDYRFSSARWYLLNRSVGVPITPLF